MSSDQELFSHRKTTGRENAAAKFIASCTAPWFIAPSPKTVSATRSVPSWRPASAAPQAMGAPAPTMLFSPKNRWPGAVRCADPPRPPLMPVARPRISANSFSGSTPQAMAQEWPR